MKSSISKKACLQYPKVFAVVENNIKFDPCLAYMKKEAFMGKIFGAMKGIGKGVGGAIASPIRRGFEATRGFFRRFTPAGRGEMLAKEMARAQEGAGKFEDVVQKMGRPSSSAEELIAGHRELTSRTSGLKLLSKERGRLNRHAELRKQLSTASSIGEKEKAIKELIDIEDYMVKRYGTAGQEALKQYGGFSETYRDYLARGGFAPAAPGESRALAKVPKQESTALAKVPKQEATQAAQAADAAKAMEAAQAKEFLEAGRQGARAWYENPWVAGAIGAGAVGIPGSLLAYKIMSDRAKERGTHAALAAGGAGLATGLLAGRLIPSVGGRLIDVGSRLAAFNAPYPYIPYY